MKGNRTMTIFRNRNLRRRIYQQARPAGLTFVQGATIVVGCMVAAFVVWGSLVILLAVGR